jgi:hypothetical protein
MVEVKFPMEMFVLTALLLLTRECKWNHPNVYLIIRCGNFISKVEQYGYYKLADMWGPRNFLLGTSLEYFFYWRAISQCKSPPPPYV